MHGAVTSQLTSRSSSVEVISAGAAPCEFLGDPTCVTGIR